MTPEQQAFADQLLKAAEDLRNEQQNEVEEMPVASECKLDMFMKLGEAKDALEDHLATPLPGEDRYGRWQRRWHGQAKLLKADVDHYQKLYDEAE